MRDGMAIDRRAFIQMTTAGAGGAVASCLLSACAGFLGAADPTAVPGLSAAYTQTPGAASMAALTPDTPSPTQVPSSTPSPPEGSLGRVALVRTDDRVQGARRALELLEINPVRDKSILLKPNFNSADPFPGSTHTDTLRTLIDLLREMGAGEVTIGDRSGMGDTRAVMRAKDVPDMASELGIKTLIFDELTTEEWAMMQPGDSHWKSGFAIPKAVLRAEGIVQTCCLKTHRYGGHFTLSLKNSVGFAAKRIPGNRHDFMTELHNSRHQRRMIAEINAAYTPDLILLDGMEAFIDGGPDQGTKVAPSVMIAGTDRVAIDAVGVAILRHYGTTPEVQNGPIFGQEQIARAVELGLGVDQPESIELVTGDGTSASFARQIQAILAQG
jgi:uncharacterized protein (DUF362 family)